jgi:hypothetical protein
LSEPDKVTAVLDTILFGGALSCFITYRDNGAPFKLHSKEFLALAAIKRHVPTADRLGAAITTTAVERAVCRNNDTTFHAGRSPTPLRESRACGPGNFPTNVKGLLQQDLRVAVSCTAAKTPLDWTPETSGHLGKFM